MDTQYDIVTLATVASTQDEARTRFADTGTALLIVSGEQVAGRGRQGRQWAQPDRGMYASLAFTSVWALPDRTLIPLVAAVAMRRAIESSLSVDVGLKWPNDLMVENLKAGGILVEANGDVIVVGCGVNLWWGEPMTGAASLLEDDPGFDAAMTLADAWANSLLTLLDEGALMWPRTEYERASVTLGQEVHWDAGTGTAVGIAVDGALVVESDGERIDLHSGEVHTHRGR
jgi:BirA family biotin operon repressor/biotin-[acetyl-CoA-carboxylase] ligase